MPIYKGKNVDEAIENGLYELNLKKNEVRINIIEKGNAGIFGFFEKEAEVEITPLSSMELKFKKLIPYLTGAGVTFIILLLVLFGGNSDKSTTVSTPSSTETSSVVEKSVEKTSESFSTSSNSTPASSSSTNTTSSSTKTSSTSLSQTSIITVENNEDFKSLIQTKDKKTKSKLVKKLKDQTTEFDAYIDKITKKITKFDVTIYPDNYIHNEQPIANFIFSKSKLTSNSAFKSFNNKNFIDGQKIHIRAKIQSYNDKQDLIYLSPIEISPR